MPEAQAPPAIGSICWSEVCTKDPEKVKTFYSKLLGWTTQTIPIGPRTYTMFEIDGKPFGGIEVLTGEKAGRPAQWLNYFAVADVDASTKRVETLGGKVTVKPAEIPGMGRYSIVTDPTGVTFALYQSAR